MLMTRTETLADGMTLHMGDCRDILPNIGKVEAVVTDPPYGMTDSSWDTAPNVAAMWRALKTSRNDAVFILTASQPFTSAVVLGNEKDFRVEWIWEKNAGSNFGTVKWQPMKEHESILVFAKATPAYSPVMEQRAPSGAARVKTVVNYDSQPEAYSGVTGKASSMRPDLRYPRSIQKFNRERGLHPNQKPVAMIEYFLRTYTKEGDTVLDPYMGSGTTGMACKNLGRKFIGIEIEPKYFDIACRRIIEAPTRAEEPAGLFGAGAL
jgi:site-specific DNA-methyltransferase (adenine-specific)